MVVSTSSTSSIWAMLIMHLLENASALGEIPEPSTRNVQPSAMARLMSLTTSSSFSGSYTRLHAHAAIRRYHSRTSRAASAPRTLHVDTSAMQEGVHLIRWQLSSALRSAIIHKVTACGNVKALEELQGCGRGRVSGKWAHSHVMECVADQLLKGTPLSNVPASGSLKAEYTK